ncbi:MAG: HlyD family secretion protein [Candidatus Acidiferrales bacterium]
MAPPTDTEIAPSAPAENQAAHETPPANSHRYSRRTAFLQGPHARLYIAGMIFVLLLAGFFLWRYFASYESTDDAEVDGHLMPLSTRISGYVQKVNVDDNESVKAGAVLVEIDPRDYQTALDQARANLANSQATAEAQNLNVPITSVSTTSQVSSSESDVRSAEAGIEAAQHQFDAATAQLAQAEANNTRAQADLIRYKMLVDQQEVSQQTYDQALATAKDSAAAVNAARDSAAAQKQQVSEAQDKLLSAQAALRTSQTGPRQLAASRARALSAAADVLEKQALVEQAELNLQYTKIIAPVDGVVSKNVEVGMNVQPGQQLLTIVPLADVWVTADFKETQLKHMRPGQPAEIHVDSTGRNYKGHVDSIPGASGARLSLLPPENATGNYVKVVQRLSVKIVIDPGEDSDLSLRLGMSVEPKVFVTE